MKGGRLAIAAPEATKVSLLVPDVPLRSLDALSSGPTSPDHSTVEEVRAILAKYDLAREAARLGPRIFRARRSAGVARQQGMASAILSRSCHGPGLRRPARSRRRPMTGEDEAFRDSVFEILLSSHDLVENARALAQKAGYFVAVDNTCDDWDYADAARYLLERFHALRKPHPRLCLISVGEVTVTMDRTPGAGGRNQQFAMACALELEQLSRRAADGIQRRFRRHRRQHADRPGPSPTRPPWHAPTPSDFT